MEWVRQYVWEGRDNVADDIAIMNCRANRASALTMSSMEASVIGENVTSVSQFLKYLLVPVGTVQSMSVGVATVAEYPGEFQKCDDTPAWFCSTNVGEEAPYRSHGRFAFNNVTGVSYTLRCSSTFTEFLHTRDVDYALCSSSFFVYALSTTSNWDSNHQECLLLSWPFNFTQRDPMRGPRWKRCAPERGNLLRLHYWSSLGGKSSDRLFAALLPEAISDLRFDDALVVAIVFNDTQRTFCSDCAKGAAMRGSLSPCCTCPVERLRSSTAAIDIAHTQRNMKVRERFPLCFMTEVRAQVFLFTFCAKLSLSDLHCYQCTTLTSQV